MKFAKTIWFALHNMSRYSLHYAGAEMCGGDTRRARSDAYRALKNLGSQAVQAQVYDRMANAAISGQAQDRP
ncbi:MAG: hypothetical protein AAGA38_02890 [Pseudomonadota bacterium]